MGTDVPVEPQEWKYIWCDYHDKHHRMVKNKQGSWVEFVPPECQMSIEGYIT